MDVFEWEGGEGMVDGMMDDREGGEEMEDDDAILGTGS